MKCDNCGSADLSPQLVDRSFHVGDKLVLIEAIPATVCQTCGEATFDAEVAERIRRMVHEPHAPVRKIEAEVLRYDAA